MHKRRFVDAMTAPYPTSGVPVRIDDNPSALRDDDDTTVQVDPDAMSGLLEASKRADPPRRTNRHTVPRLSIPTPIPADR